MFVQQQAELFELPSDDAAPSAGPRSGRCRRCNRTLRNPASIAAGIGPTCNGTRKEVHMRPNYEFAVEGDVVSIVEAWSQGFARIAGAPEVVVRDLVGRGIDVDATVIVYKGKGGWSGIYTRNGLFSGFERMDIEDKALAINTMRMKRE